MKKGIRFNLFIVVGGVLVGLLLVGFLLNQFFLEHYYIYKSEATLHAIASNTVAVINDNSKIDDIAREEGVTISILDYNMKLIYSPSSTSRTSTRLPSEVEKYIVESNRNQEDISKYFVLNKNKDGQPKLMYVMNYKNNKYIVISKPMKGLSESVAISNEFYLFAGMIMLVVGGFVVYYFSKTFTSPIIEMNNTTKAMANLQFDNQLEINASYELQELATNINLLSSKLEATIHEMKEDVEYHKLLSRNISHEFKTPIAIIKGYAEGLLFGIVTTQDDYTKYLQTIVNECDRMDALVMEILMLSKLSSNHFVLEDYTTCSIQDLLTDCYDQYHTIMKDKEITYQVEGDIDIKVKGNYALLLQALLNIYKNAIQHCEEDKLILVKIIQSDAIYISIYNSGKAIPEHEQAHIFKEFYQSDVSRNRETSGHGLGLAIVQTIVSLHHGEIAVTNEKDGVTFHITLPK